MTAYYNEFDPKAAAWLRELIRRDLIAPGDVDERSIEDVTPDDLRPYTQCHFFAGIGVWSYSLRLAGWPDDRPVWTGSCPCQPFSAAGKGAGVVDPRHLWPSQFWLIQQCKPDVWLGEQVASKNGLYWFDLVRHDLERAGYAVGVADTSSALTGAPHIRQRLRIGAKRLDDAASARRFGALAGPEGTAWDEARLRVSGAGSGRGLGGLAEPDGRERRGIADGQGRERNGAAAGWQQGDGEPEPCGEPERLADTNDAGSQGWLVGWDSPGELAALAGGVELQGQPGPVDGFWRYADWLFCRDGKWRPVEPGTFPLAHGSPARVGRLRGYGNAVDAIATKIFIEAFDEAVFDPGLMSDLTTNEGIFA